MKSSHVNPYVPAKYSRDVGDYAIIAAGQESKWARSSAARRRATQEAKRNAERNAGKYTPQTQPRDPDGKFRKILARLKLNLGDKSTEQLAKKIESTEAAQVAGDYGLMHQHSNELLDMLDAVDSGSLPKGVARNLRKGASDLGKVLAYLPLPQGQSGAKVRFSDLPPASADMVRDMVRRVKDRLEPDVAEKYIAALEQYMAGARTMNSDEMAQHLNKILRVLA